jgi:membrane fusion protein, multidrug efflux system
MMIKKYFLLTALFGGFFCPLNAEQVEHTTYKTIGTIYPQYRSVLGSQVSGYVEEVCVEVGDHVKKGDVLLKLDPTLFSIAVAEANSSCTLARIERQDAEKDFERMKKLFEKPSGESPSISQKRYEDAMSRAEKAKVTLEKAEDFLQRAKRNEEDTKIKAPFDGVITKRFVHPGEPVSVTPVVKLIEVLSINNPYVEFSVPQHYVRAIHVGSEISMRMEGITVEPNSFTIDRTYPDIDEKTRSFKCRATLPETFGKYSGALVEVVISMKGE